MPGMPCMSLPGCDVDGLLFCPDGWLMPGMLCMSLLGCGASVFCSGGWLMPGMLLMSSAAAVDASVSNNVVIPAAVDAARSAAATERRDPSFGLGDLHA